MLDHPVKIRVELISPEIIIKFLSEEVVVVFPLDGILMLDEPYESESPPFPSRITEVNEVPNRVSILMLDTLRRVSIPASNKVRVAIS
jgi:hypothetical protein